MSQKAQPAPFRSPKQGEPHKRKQGDYPDENGSFASKGFIFGWISLFAHSQIV